ncbi:MAG: FtsQ-type POTRA domain-containing protein [Chloroflexi bacterium]|nr:FtsQ-type POTRA domain-containing protein [Chloroflexota bacterium]
MSPKRELTRAEIARQRRAQRAAKELTQTTKRAVKPITPVASRNFKLTAMTVPQKLVKRRKFNISIGLPRIQWRMPVIHLPRLRPGWRMTSFAIILLLSTAMYLALTLPYFHVPHISLMGANRMSREEIETAMGVSGQSIFAVQPDVMEARLRMNYPDLASVNVDAYLPNHVFVTVSERQPLILWQEGAGFTWVDANGVAFRPRGEASGLIPVIGSATPPPGSPDADDPLSPPAYMQKELVDAILVLAPHVPAGSTITFDSADGLGWTDGRGWKVAFGTSAQDMPLKIRVYESLVQSLISRGKFPQFISVIYPDAPFYKMAEVETPDETVVDDGQ